MKLFHNLILQTGHAGVNVGVDEAGHEAAAAQVHLAPRPRQLLGLGEAAHVHDLPRPGHQALRVAGLILLEMSTKFRGS